MSGNTLVARQDAIGDVLLAGPAVRAVANGSSHTTFLSGPRGRAAAELLPGIDRHMTWSAAWIDPDQVAPTDMETQYLVDHIKAFEIADAVVLTSDHQSPLPLALLLRLAGVARVTAISHDFAGSLLTTRVTDPGDVPERVRALHTVRAAGYQLPVGDDGLLFAQTSPFDAALLPSRPYVVLHPGTSVPARAWPIFRWVELAHLLAARGVSYVVTGHSSELSLADTVASAGGGTNLAGRTTLAQLGSVMKAAEGVVVGNTGPAHIAAAVGASIVSLFAPTVPARRWAPDTEDVVVLGDASAPCVNTRVTSCPFDGHPCLTNVTGGDVVRALESMCETHRAADLAG